MSAVVRATLLGLALALSGCTANMAGYIEAMGKDPTNVCVAISTPYGGGVAGRANTPGVRLNLSGGQCTIDVPAK